METPFDNFLIFDTDKKIKSINFSASKDGLELTGDLKKCVLKSFDERNLAFFDYSSIDFDKTKKSYGLYEFLINTKTGETYAYSDVAYILFKDRRYARGVAMMLHTNPFVFFVPCHRVVAKNGTGGYGSGVELKLKILRWEGAI